LSLRGDQPDAYKLLGRIHVVNESPALAERAFIRAIQLWPQDSEAVYLLGRLYQSIGRLDEAARAFEKALELAPNLVRAQAYLGTVYFGLGRDVEAAELLERSVAVNSDNSKPDFVPHLEYGIYLQRMDRLEQSVAQLQRAAKLGSSNLEAWLELGRTLYRLNRLDEASRALRKAAELDSKDSRPHYLLARICYERGDSRCGDRHAERAEWNRDGEPQ
jgi:Flp pilus assembly protein TadD